MEGLEIRLNAGAATRIGTGDRQGYGRLPHLHIIPETLKSCRDSADEGS
jgi:hypothetical protein